MAATDSHVGTPQDRFTAAKKKASSNSHLDYGPLSDYEIKQERITENKRKFNEILGLYDNENSYITIMELIITIITTIV